jgi:hypothetical protein
MKIHRRDREQVAEKVCDIANATETDADPMYAVHVEGMMRLLDELEVKYGPSPGFSRPVHTTWIAFPRGERRMLEVVVSRNMAHLVNVQKVERINAVNERASLPSIRIHTPEEVLDL